MINVYLIREKDYIMKEKLRRFLTGRYGVDKLTRHLITLGLVTYLITLFFRNPFLQIPSIIIFIYGYYRVFSKNTLKRYQELCAYERFLSKLKGGPGGLKEKFNSWRKYHIYKCPNCQQKIRIPRGRGNIEIRCQKCGTTFRKHA